MGFLGQSLQQWMPMGSYEKKTIFFFLWAIIENRPKHKLVFLKISGIILLQGIRYLTLCSASIFSSHLRNNRSHDTKYRGTGHRRIYSLCTTCIATNLNLHLFNLKSIALLIKFNLHLCLTSTKMRICKIFFEKIYTYLYLRRQWS